jgi:hypothetical protein
MITPGPWKYWPAPDEPDAEGLVESGTILDSELNTLIPSRPIFIDRRPQYEANARAIALVPEMVKFIEYIAGFARVNKNDTIADAAADLLKKLNGGE